MSTIAYLRHLFPEESFYDKTLNGLQLKVCWRDLFHCSPCLHADDFRTVSPVFNVDSTTWSWRPPHTHTVLSCQALKPRDPASHQLCQWLEQAVGGEVHLLLLQGEEVTLYPQSSNFQGNHQQPI